MAAYDEGLYTEKLAARISQKATEQGINLKDQNISDQQMSALEELTRDAQDEVKKELGMVDE